MPLFSFNNHGVTISGASVHSRWAEVPHGVDLKRAPVLPCDGTRLHVASAVKIGVNLDVDALLSLFAIHSTQSPLHTARFQSLFFKICSADVNGSVAFGYQPTICCGGSGSLRAHKLVGVVADLLFDLIADLGILLQIGFDAVATLNALIGDGEPCARFVDDLQFNTKIHDFSDLGDLWDVLHAQQTYLARSDEREVPL